MRHLQICLSLALLALSNSVYSQCGVPPLVCDANLDRAIDQADIDALVLAKGTQTNPGSHRDPDQDLVITTLDARFCVTQCDQGVNCEVPKVLGPLLPANEMHLSADYLTDVGYQTEEYILADIARSFSPTSMPLPTDGKISAVADPEDVAGDFNTRMVVYRPINPADFDGRVVVEWLNVSAGAEANPNWVMGHNELVRKGAAWVGVSAQQVGVNQLANTFNPVRYGSLVHPGDSYSYDIFSKAGLQIAEAASTVLGGLTADRVIAAGESQSAMRMVTYIDAVHPLHNIYDGFFVHSRFNATRLSQSPLPNIPLPSPTPIRDDLSVPVIVVQAEGDVIGMEGESRQPATTAMVREWEMAGTAHADSYTLIGAGDPGDGSRTHTMFGFLREPRNNFNCVNGFSAGPHWLIVQAAHTALDNWITTSIAPPNPPLLTVQSTSPFTLSRDVHGNALGGIRTPHVDVPIATLDDDNAAPPGGFPFCALFGRTIPFSEAKVMQLYPTHADFIQQWSASVDASVAAGFVPFEEGVFLKDAASGWLYPE